MKEVILKLRYGEIRAFIGKKLVAVLVVVVAVVRTDIGFAEHDVVEVIDGESVLFGDALYGLVASLYSFVSVAVLGGLPFTERGVPSIRASLSAPTLFMRKPTASL